MTTAQLPAESLAIATIAARAAQEKLATNIAVLDVREPLSICDIFVIASADTERQVDAIVEEIEFQMKEQSVPHAKREGVRESRWSLLDYETVVVHVMRTAEREFYGLDRLYMDCPIVAIDGVDPYEREATWADEVDIRSVDSIEEIPLVGTDPSEGEI
ncbi:MAG: ribosome silencing factor [Corynebacterium sp.]|nr:ribosome silencing factor [Corynebacterium sp.]